MRHRRAFHVGLELFLETPVFESSHVPLHVWLQAMHLLCSSKKGISSNQLSASNSVTGTASISASVNPARIQ
jgi:hypothetical protein